MKILQIVDVPYWAIGKLSNSIVTHNPQFQWRTLYVHPKHVAEHLDEVREHIEWADLIDWQYWNTARQLMELLPELKKKKSVLTHHNEKDLLSGDWTDISMIIAETKKSEEVLKQHYQNVKLIPLAINLDEFKYNDKLPKTKTVGYAGRVVPWKGLREIAKACYELNYRLLMMGKFDKPDYWNSIPPEHQANIDLSYLDCESDDRVNFYHELDVFVQNSSAGRETGTLPLMEAMACGVPVLTTPAGIAADICEDHENAVCTPFDNYEELKANLLTLMNDDELKEKIRRNAWNTIKNFSEEKRAWEYRKVYHQVYDPIHPLVSVVIPTTPDRWGQTLDILQGLNESTYKHIEAVICIDQSEGSAIDNVLNREAFNFPIKAVHTGKIGGYNLALARNLGVIEAAGEIIVFCDSRMKPDPEAILHFVMALDDKSEKVWVYGNKGTGKKTFVENFSAIGRDHFIKAGMCNERIDRYGGMSQELRSRFLAQGFRLLYLDNAKATQLSSSHMNEKRRSDIVASKTKLWKMGLND